MYSLSQVSLSSASSITLGPSGIREPTGCARQTTNQQLEALVNSLISSQVLAKVRAMLRSRDWE